MHNKDACWWDEAKSMVPFDASLDRQCEPTDMPCGVLLQQHEMPWLFKRQTQNIHRENRSLIASSKCRYPKLKRMYKLQYVSKSLVSAMQSSVKVSTCVQTSVHEATHTRLER